MARKSSVAGSPYEGEIRELLMSGWSPERVRWYLVQRHGEEGVPQARAILRYRKQHIPPTAILPASLIQQAMKGLHYQVDTLRLMDDLIWAQEQRLAMVWQRERDTNTADPRLDNMLRTFLEYLERRQRMAVELGVEPRPGRTARLERHQEEVLEIPESHLQEMLAFMRERRERWERRG